MRPHEHSRDDVAQYHGLLDLLEDQGGDRRHAKDQAEVGDQNWEMLHVGRWARYFTNVRSLSWMIGRIDVAGHRLMAYVQGDEGMKG